MKAKLLEIQNHLNASLIGRDNIIKSALLALVAKENSLLIGPPGTAKSLLARRISQTLQSLSENEHTYFEYLLTKFSTPEEIFGPLSISELKQDRFLRNTQGYLPTAQVAFLDEIFKASSSILNALLTILNERKYHNGTTSTNVPLISLIGASNELPTGQSELSALYDRFLIRCFVDYVEANQLYQFFDITPPSYLLNHLSKDDIDQIHQKAANVVFPKEVQEAVCKIWADHNEAFKENSDETLSDRRFVKVINLMKISAATNDRNSVDFSDVFLLKDCLWNHPDNKTKVIDIIKTVLKQFDKPVAIASSDMADFNNQVTSSTPTKSQHETHGLLGSGTEDDPILIENLQHLKRLEKPEIGQQGYYFKQTADIDCSAIDEDSWFSIEFIGHYDGNHKKIIGSSSEDSGYYLFKTITDSEIKNINLDKLGLSDAVKDSTCVQCQCQAAFNLFDTVENSQISHCQGAIIAKHVKNSTLNCCKSRSVLVRCDVDSSHITDCQVLLELPIYNDPCHEKASGIAQTVINNSTVERCFVSGEIVRYDSYYPLYFQGVAHTVENSKLCNNAIGIINTGTDDISFDYRICAECSDVQIDNNIAITNPNQSFDNDLIRNGKTIAPVLFTQDYFEHDLGWDFTTIWQWNDKRNEPELRATESQSSSQNLSMNTGSLLAQQLQANIWL